MAAIPQSFERRPRAGKAPVSAHPAFPVVVAIWFAALLGLGSLVLPAALIERLVTATGLADLLPFAAPPLGMKARALIALAAAVVGAGIGWLAARKVGGNAEPVASGRNPRGAGRRPLNAHADLGPDGFDGDAPRRRALTINEEERPSEWLQVAPLPGQPVFETADVADLDADPELAQWEAEADAPLELELDEVVPEAAPEFAQVEPAPMPAFDLSERQVFRPQEDLPRQFDAPIAKVMEEETVPMREEPRQMFRPATAMTPEPEQEVASEVETVEERVEPIPAFAPPLAAVPTGISAVADEADLPARPALPEWAKAPIEDLGLMQLVQRLGVTLERHREWAASQRALAVANAASAAAPVQAFRAPVFDAGLGPVDAEEAARAMAAFFAEPAAAAEPAALDAAEPEDGLPFPSHSERQLFRPVVDDGSPVMRSFPGLEALEGSESSDFRDEGEAEEEDDDELERLAATFSLPLRREVGAPAEASPDFASLAQMANPFRQGHEEFVRIQEPENPFEEVRPAVIFPHEAARAVGTAGTASRPFDPPPAATVRPSISSEDSAQALREALMNLQRVGTGN